MVLERITEKTDEREILHHWEFCFLGSWNGILAIMVSGIFRLFVVCNIIMLKRGVEGEGKGRERGVKGMSIDIEWLLVYGR